MYAFKRNKTKGFTLIELLVVVAIIAILSSIVFASLNSARAKTRDARRRADLRQLQTVLEFYYDVNQAYPGSGGNWRGTCSDWGPWGTIGVAGWIPNVAPTYISKLPLDPNPIGTSNCYIYKSDGANYKIKANGTVESICVAGEIPVTDPMYDPVGGGCTFQVSTPGGASL